MDVIPLDDVKRMFLELAEHEYEAAYVVVKTKDGLIGISYVGEILEMVAAGQVLSQQGLYMLEE